MKFRLILSLLILCAVTSCSYRPKSRIAQEVKNLTGKEIQFPQCEILNDTNTAPLQEIMPPEKIKMITYLSQPPCTSCIFTMLKDWECEVENNLGDNIKYILILKSNDRQAIIDAINLYQFSSPVLRYNDDVFEEINGLRVLARNRTLLLDKNNKVIAVGEPFGNDRMWNVYKKAAGLL